MFQGWTSRFSFIHNKSLSSTVVTLFLTKFEKKIWIMCYISIFTCLATFSLENNLLEIRCWQFSYKQKPLMLPLAVYLKSKIADISINFLWIWSNISKEPLVENPKADINIFLSVIMTFLYHCFPTYFSILYWLLSLIVVDYYMNNCCFCITVFQMAI